jgi:cytochrome P450
MRRQYDAVVDRLLEQAGKDPKLDERDDILAMMLQSRYDDGTAMSRDEIADQLLTLLVAGHETTATTLAWAVERLRRHPDLLRDLVTEVDDGGSALRQATILEVQRTRPVIDLIGRQVRAESLHLGRWILPRGSVVLVSIGLIHDDEATFPNARAFDPYRFKDAKPDLYQWIPWRWTSYCGRCCAISRWSRPMSPTSDGTRAVSPARRPRAAWPSSDGVPRHRPRRPARQAQEHGHERTDRRRRARHLAGL